MSTHLNIPKMKYVGVRIENKNVLKNTKNEINLNNQEHLKIQPL